MTNPDRMGLCDSSAVGGPQPVRRPTGLTALTQTARIALEPGDLVRPEAARCRVNEVGTGLMHPDIAAVLLAGDELQSLES